MDGPAAAGGSLDRALLPPPPHQQQRQPMPLHEVVHQVEAVLDLLQDELERQQHLKLTGGGVGSGAGGAGGLADEAGVQLHKAGSRYLQVRKRD